MEEFLNMLKESYLGVSYKECNSTFHYDGEVIDTTEIEIETGTPVNPVFIFHSGSEELITVMSEQVVNFEYGHKTTNR